jgi:hypothetical protein
VTDRSLTTYRENQPSHLAQRGPWGVVYYERIVPPPWGSPDMGMATSAARGHAGGPEGRVAAALRLLEASR